MSVNSERYPLQDLLLADLLSANKLIIFLLALIVISATGTIWLTHQTRMLIAEKGELIFEKQALENEYLNLQLEETALSDNSRIEAIATTKLDMKPVNSTQEVIVIE